MPTETTICKIIESVSELENRVNSEVKAIEEKYNVQLIANDEKLKFPIKILIIADINKIKT